jgi:hypothetical protein
MMGEAILQFGNFEMLRSFGNRLFAASANSLSFTDIRKWLTS